MVEIADAIAHANYFWLPLFLFQEHVMELEAILVVSQENLDAHEVQEVPEVVHLVNQRELQDH